jgi:hypothetical protein
LAALQAINHDELEMILEKIEFKCPLITRKKYLLFENSKIFTLRPTAILIGHKFGLNDVKIHTSKRVVLSYDKDAVLKVWGLDTAECLQTLPIHFPR